MEIRNPLRIRSRSSRGNVSMPSRELLITAVRSGDVLVTVRNRWIEF
jgi:hypothetical protein